MGYFQVCPPCGKQPLYQGSQLTNISASFVEHRSVHLLQLKTRSHDLWFVISQSHLSISSLNLVSPFDLYLKYAAILRHCRFTL